MIIADYFQAFKQINFSSDAAQQRVLGSFSDALMSYSKDITNSADAKLTQLNSFYFGLPVMEDNTFDNAIQTEDMFAIAKVNQEVLEIEVNRIFRENNISTAVPVTFSIDKFGHLAAANHPDAAKIMKLINEQPALASRIESALSDAGQAAHQAHLDLLEFEASQPHSRVTKKALLHEKDRLVVPHAEITLFNGQTSVTYSGMSFSSWLMGQKNLLDNIIAQNEKEQLSLLLNM